MRNILEIGRNRSANVAIFLAICIVPLIGIIGIALDLTRAHNAKSHVQSAMDTAVLWAAKELTSGGDEEAALAQAKEVFASNIDTIERSVSCGQTRIVADMNARTVDGYSTCLVPLSFGVLVSGENLEVDAASQSIFGGQKIEIALMLDVSGSMRGQRLSDLKNASNALIDTLIPTSHTGDVRISLVPYATSINAGTYGDIVTGITDLFAHTVANLGADPDKLVAALNVGDTSEAFDLVDAVGNAGLGSISSDFFACADTPGPVPLSDPEQSLCVVRGDNGVGSDDCQVWVTMPVTLADLPESSFPVRSSTNLQTFYNDGDDDDEPDCESGCPYSDIADLNDYTYEDIHGVPIPDGCADSSGSASDIATNWQSLDWTSASMAYSNYDFSILGETHEANVGSASCVTDRGGSEAFTDASPVTFPMGARSSACPGAPVEPLTNNKMILSNSISSLNADGWTAGHLGVAWTWYTLSTEWSSVWPFNRRTESGGTELVNRFAILMTDGSFNTYYETGQGDSAAQARALCAGMKADDIIIFAVAFDAPPEGQSVLRDCATSNSTYYEAKNGIELVDVYRQIASNVSNVRLSQ